MLAEERYSRIMQQLNIRKSVTVNELMKLLNASESTVRRDLHALHEMKRLNKVFGGATLEQSKDIMKESSMTEKRILCREEKERIARYAASLIHDNDFVFVDAGSTIEILIEFIGNTKATFVTNAVAHATRLIQKNISVRILGGKLKANTEAVVGAEALGILRQYNFTKCFIGTNGISIDKGLTTPDVEEAVIKRECVRRSFVTYVLADHSKFDCVSSVTFAELDDVCVITDSVPRKEFLDNASIKVVDDEK